MDIRKQYSWKSRFTVFVVVVFKGHHLALLKHLRNSLSFFFLIACDCSPDRKGIYIFKRSHQHYEMLFTVASKF